MGKLYQGIEGPFSGKVGSVVGYMWKNRSCIRAYRHQVNYPDTIDQQHQRNWFVSMVRFASQATAALKLGLAPMATVARMTEGNYFILKNKQHFLRDGNNVQIDYSKLQIAMGSATDVYFHKPRFEKNETVIVDFEKNAMSLRASSDDLVYVYIYASGSAQGLLAAPVARRSKQLRIVLPQEWSGQEVHLYGFVVDREGRASNSTYIGVGRVNHYEDRGKYIPLDNNWQEFVELANGTSQKEDETTMITPSEVTPEEAKDPPEVP